MLEKNASIMYKSLTNYANSMQSCLHAATKRETKKKIWNCRELRASISGINTTLRARKSCWHSATKGEGTKRSGTVNGMKHANLFTNRYRSGDQNIWNKHYAKSTQKMSTYRYQGGGDQTIWNCQGHKACKVVYRPSPIRGPKISGIGINILR